MSEHEKVLAIANIWNESSLNRRVETQQNFETGNTGRAYDMYFPQDEYEYNDFVCNKDMSDWAASGVRVHKNADIVIENNYWISKPGKNLGIEREIFKTSNLVVVRDHNLMPCNDQFTLVPVVPYEYAKKGDDKNKDEYCKHIGLYLFRFPISEHDTILTFVKNLGEFNDPIDASIAYDSSKVLIKLNNKSVYAIAIEIPEEVRIEKKHIEIDYNN